jgi:hypothetical protein
LKSKADQTDEIARSDFYLVPPLSLIPSLRRRLTIRIRYRILNARLAAGAVSAGQGGGVDQAYDGWRG